MDTHVRVGKRYSARPHGEPRRPAELPRPVTLAGQLPLVAPLRIVDDHHAAEDVGAHEVSLVPCPQNLREHSDACGVPRRAQRVQRFEFFQGAPGTQLSWR